MDPIDWQAKVYRPPLHIESGLEHAEWCWLRDSVLRRDRWTCIRCAKAFRAKKQLTAHHLVSRANGGSNDMSNLVTLCNSCHDYVEINDLRTRTEIIGSYDNPAVIIVKSHDPEKEEVDPYNRPEWHKFVYGGQRRKPRN
jgi:hypothetical protein